jgi:hypothetical protein
VAPPCDAGVDQVPDLSVEPPIDVPPVRIDQSINSTMTSSIQLSGSQKNRGRAAH